MDEAKLIRRLQRRSRGALDQAIKAFTPYVGAVVWRTAAGTAASREDIEEAVSDVFLTLWARAGDINSEKGLRPWLAAVAHNRAVDMLRRLPPTCPLEDSQPSIAPGPAELAERRERVERLWQAVDALEEPDRTLFLRYYYEGEMLKTVARDLDMNLSTAKTKLARGRKKLKDILTKGGEP